MHVASVFLRWLAPKLQPRETAAMLTPDDTLAAWPGHWLTVGCACGRTVHLPTKLLARQHGPAARLPAVVARLRCNACNGRVTSATMTENPQSGATGFAVGFPFQGRRESP